MRGRILEVTVVDAVSRAPLPDVRVVQVSPHYLRIKRMRYHRIPVPPAAREAAERAVALLIEYRGGR